jgi:hypothetical protein
MISHPWHPTPADEAKADFAALMLQEGDERPRAPWEDEPMGLLCRRANRRREEHAARWSALWEEVQHGIGVVVLVAVVLAATLGGWALCAPIVKQLEPPPPTDKRVWMPQGGGR